jgi:ASC-1-like (ASCH) protein
MVKKIYETRVNDPKRQQMKKGDIITISHNTKKSLKPYQVIISGRRKYKTFRATIKDSGVKKLLPDVNTIEQAIKTYESFPHDEGSYKEGAKKYGVVRFKFTVL